MYIYGLFLREREFTVYYLKVVTFEVFTGKNVSPKIIE